MFKKFTKKFKRKKGAQFKQPVRIEKDWSLGLVSFFALVLLVAAVGAYMFTTIGNIMVDEEIAGEEQAEELDRALLEETVEHFEKKRENHELLRNSYTGAPRI